MLRSCLAPLENYRIHSQAAWGSLELGTSASRAGRAKDFVHAVFNNPRPWFRGNLVSVTRFFLSLFVLRLVRPVSCRLLVACLFGAENVHALEGLACRKRVAPASSPASHCKQGAALMSPTLHACGCARPSRACFGHSTVKADHTIIATLCCTYICEPDAIITALVNMQLCI